MKILLLTHAFNGLAQRLYVDLRAAGHGVGVGLDIGDGGTEGAGGRQRPRVGAAE